MAVEEEVRRALRELRTKAGLTQEEVADRLRQPQSLVSKLESGERSLHLTELDDYAAALGVNPTTVLNRIASFDSILDRWEFSESEFTELIDSNPSLRGMVLGYAAEVKFRRMFLAHRADIVSEKDDDHDRGKKGDRRVRYRGRDIIVEVKSLQTNMVSFDEATNRWTGKSQVDGSDRRIIKFKDGSTLNTTLLLRGEFDILAVNCFAFGGTWRFAFALNSDLAPSTYRKYTEGQRDQLIASLQAVSWPPEPPFTTDFEAILDRAHAAKQPSPRVMEIKEQ